ncbi:MAG: ParB/RepB/Spo0J family partition protein [Clostridia bacterium]|nr:ParB/RepB/Spo0J family partition protein [Clostridia bacterium]
MMYTPMQPAACLPQEIMLPVDRIRPRPSLHDTRDSGTLQELAESIAQTGLVRPLLVRRTGNGRYIIVSGNRRLTACRMLGLPLIRARVLMDDAHTLPAETLIDALLSGRFHYMEEGDALRTLYSAHGMGLQELADMLGRHVQIVTEQMQLASFDEDVRVLLMEEDAPMEVARTLLSLQDDALRMAAARRITRERLCVCDAALLVQAMARRDGKEPGVEKWENKSIPKHTGKVIGVVRDQRLYINALRDIAKQMRCAGIRTTVSEEEKPGRLEMTISISTRRRRAARYQSM